MLDKNERNEVAVTESVWATQSAWQAPASQPDKAQLIQTIRNAGPYQQALQITLRPPRPRREAVAALDKYVRELSAAKEVQWPTHMQVGSVAGYFLTRKFTEIDPRDGIAKERMRSILLLPPNGKSDGRHAWLNSVYWPGLSCDIDGNYYFRRSVMIALEVVNDAIAVTQEMDAAFADPPMLLALGSFGRLGLEDVWLKPYFKK